MSDQGFDFRPPAPRREPRRFEPPPWEKDQFEQHRREKAEREEATREVDADVAAASEPESQEQEPAPPAEQPDESAPPANEAQVDDKQVELMLLGLRAEEPETLKGAWAVNASAGGLVGLVGLVVGAWGTAALFRQGMGTAGTLGGMVLVVFGLSFVGIGGWLVYRALRQRGVL